MINGAKLGILRASLSRLHGSSVRMRRLALQGSVFNTLHCHFAAVEICGRLVILLVYSWCFILVTAASLLVEGLVALEAGIVFVLGGADQAISLKDTAVRWHLGGFCQVVEGDGGGWGE